MPDVDLRQLRYLVAVADEGGFTQAAQRLSMTQPALSRAVGALERAVGVPLLVRGRRGVRLTEAGTLLAGRAREIDDRVGAAVREARAAAAPVLRVNAQGCEVDVLHRLVGTFTAGSAEPAVVERAADAVHAGEAHVALIRGPFDGAGLDSDVLESRARVVLLSAGHPLSGRPFVHRAELARDPVIGWPVHSRAERDYWLGAEAYEGEVVAGPEVHDMFHLLARVRGGEAVAFMPERIREAVTIPPDVRAVPVPDLAPERLSVAWPTDATSAVLASFVRHATSAFEDTGR